MNAVQFAKAVNELTARGLSSGEMTCTQVSGILMYAALDVRDMVNRVVAEQAQSGIVQARTPLPPHRHD